VTIFVDTSEATAERRGLTRDAEKLGGIEAARRLYLERYRPAFDLYARSCAPASTADAVFDNEDFKHPRLAVRPGGRLSGNWPLG
jgi:uridine kinase